MYDYRTPTGCRAERHPSHVTRIASQDMGVGSRPELADVFSHECAPFLKNVGLKFTNFDEGRVGEDPRAVFGIR